MNTKKIALVAFVPVAVLFLSGCGEQKTPAAPSPTPQATTQPQATPKANEDNSVAKPLPPLPVNSKSAIDTEIKNIDKELQAADTAISSDTTDTSLGL